MRQGWAWAVLGAACSVLASCAEPVKAAVREDVLVLEVGGEQASLREALRALGREVGAPKRLRPVEQQPEPPVEQRADQERRRREQQRRRPDPDPGEAPEGGPGTTAPPEPDPEPERQYSEWITVKLRKGETLIHVARRHLGNGNRYNEIVEWNGFTPAQLKRLQIGHPIKLKRSEMR